MSYRIKNELFYICFNRRIVVDQHGGTLTCHSVVGQEAEFMIELPIVQVKKRQTLLFASLPPTAHTKLPSKVVDRGDKEDKERGARKRK
jgi:hypothetical protein